MFKDILKRIAYLFVYLPALPAIWYGCKYAFYLGQTEPIGATLAEAGLSNFEVTFFGFLTFSEVFFEIISRLGSALFSSLIELSKLIFFLILCFIALWVGYHSSRRHEIKRFIYLKHTEFKFYRTYKYKPQRLKFLEYFFSIYTVIILLIIAFAFIHNSYEKGKEQIKKSLYTIYEKKDFSNTGIVTENNRKYKVYKIVCGSYKCIGLDLDKNQNTTFLPEQYKQNFSYKNFKEHYKKK